MLVLSRKVGEEVVIAGEIKVTVCRIDGNQVRLGFQAPPSVHIVRAELKPLDKVRPVRSRSKRSRSVTAKANGNTTPEAGPTASGGGVKLSENLTGTVTEASAWLRRRAR